MNRKELMKLFDKYEIEYRITDNAKEVEEGLKLFDEALEKIGIIIPKETQVDNITRENDTEVPKHTTEWASSDDCISRRDALKPFCGIPEVDCDNFPVEFSVKDIKRHLLSLPSVEAPKKVIAQIKVDTDEIVERIKEEYNPKQPKGTETMMVDGEPVEIDPLSYEIGYTHGQQERPKGKWLDMSDGGRIKYVWYEKYKCNKCGERGTSAWSFCPNCGAKMGSDTE